MELGVALPYMENELEYLTRETFLIKKDHKYQTAFPIISRAAQEEAHIAQLTAAPDITKALTDFTDRLHTAFGSVGYAYYGNYQDYESAKWSLLMLAYDYFMYKGSHIRDWTERPDGGRWDMIGFQKTDVTEPCFVGNHGSNSGFQQFRYEFDGIADRTPLYLSDEESDALRNFALGNAKENNPETVEALKKCGYLRKSGDTYIPDVLVLNINEIKQAAEKLDGAASSELSQMAENARTLLKNLYDKITKAVSADLPAIFSNDVHQCRLAISNIYHARGYVMAEALRSGWLLPAEKVLPAICMCEISCLHGGD